MFNWEYGFEAGTGNLDYRKDYNTNQTESFDYDSFNQLTDFGNGHQVDYYTNGNIDGKSDVGMYHYETPRPNAVSKVDNTTGTQNHYGHSIAYNSFDKPVTIEIAGELKQWDFEYGFDQQRNKMEYWERGYKEETKYYAGNFERRIDGSGNKTDYNYIYAPTGLVAIHVSGDNMQEEIKYVYTDYLGSIMAVTDNAGNVENRFFYDAWGNRMQASEWNQTDNRSTWFYDRGFTGHEHIAGAKLINMNGRMYDPLLGRMLSPDPVLQAPYNTQNYNRYSYVLNNPLKYTDPSGYRMAYVDFLRDEAHGGGGSNWYMYNPYDYDVEFSEGFLLWNDYIDSGTSDGISFSGYLNLLDEGVQIERPEYDKNESLAKYSELVNGGVRGEWKEIMSNDNLEIGWTFLISEVSAGYASNSGSGENNGVQVISVANGMAAAGPVGAMFDFGGVVDDKDGKLYMTIGYAFGFGATSGMGYSQTGKGVNVENMAGRSSGGSLSIPFTPLGVERYGDLGNTDGYGGDVYKGTGGNIGLGAGWFGYISWTILFTPPPSDFWIRPGKTMR